MVIVTYGRPEMVRRCLQSLTTPHASPQLNITVVDNASPDETPDVVARNFPSVRLIRRDTNDGFAVANNEALRLATSPYILVLNPDTEVTQATIHHLTEVLGQHPDIGVLGCRLLLNDGSPDHAAKRFIPSPRDALVYFASRLVGERRGRYVATSVGEFDFADVDAVNGAFMLIRAAALDQVGLLDERYFMYGEDLDWCVRFRKAGWRVCYDGTVSALHVKGGSAGKRRNLKLAYHFHRSMAIFFGDHVAGDLPIAVRLPVIAAIWVRFAVQAPACGLASLSALLRRRLPRNS
ncbi:MAG TPA: glycosyltransferase family 2 protein [Mycobacteriales bacterium]|nr:glycosyltransferase family 2 protein [Mycobacteriales bacterium]